jgi:hypothetical protein
MTPEEYKKMAMEMDRRHLAQFILACQQPAVPYIGVAFPAEEEVKHGSWFDGLSHTITDRATISAIVALALEDSRRQLAEIESQNS